MLLHFAGPEENAGEEGQLAMPDKDRGMKELSRKLRPDFQEKRLR